MHKQQHQAQQLLQVQWNPQIHYQVEHQGQDLGRKNKTHAWGKIGLVAILIFITAFLVTFKPQPLIKAKTEAKKEIKIARPVFLNIPIISVSAKIEPGGLDSEGRMVPPAEPQLVSWWALGTKPGDIGTAVLAGHVDTPISPEGLFYNLKDLQSGDAVYINTVEGQIIKFEVIGKQIYDLIDFPTEAVFGRRDGIYLNLVTCAGTFNPELNDFEDRLVVFTRIAE